MALGKKKATFGTPPVFFTAISTILGAILFLRFGWAVGNTGFLGTLGIVLLGHMVTIPTAMALSEIATNQKVEGGGEYYIISRSFGLNIGAAIGIALYLSQGISVAFYCIAFAEAFDPVFAWVNDSYGLDLHDKRLVSVPAILFLALLTLTKGANQGMNALYVVVIILFISLGMFFAGTTDYQADHVFDPNNMVENNYSFFYVFAIIFPAFTGMTAGVGLSGDLKDPKKSIPVGTLGATIAGMLVYILCAFKFTISASPEELATEQFAMSNIAVWGPIVPIGLAAATISSAIGSILVAPRTLQAISADKIFPGAMSGWLAKGKAKSNEPVNAGIVTIILALFFVLLGNVDTVARIISMFFMVTYGAICLISFLQHFAADPAYRPSFKSKWYLSLLGTIMTVYLMFKMDSLYAFISILVMVLIYIYITRVKHTKEGMAMIFQGVIFQISRRLQVFLQKTEKDSDNWRPSIICISSDTFKRPSAFNLLRWVSHRYGFGTYIHFINGYFSKDSYRTSQEDLLRLIRVSEGSKSNVYVDTLISPSYTSAIAQAIQLPSVSGKEINMILFEFDKNNPGENIQQLIDNFPLVKAAKFDTIVLASSDRNFGIRQVIHIWITRSDLENGTLMVLMGFVIMGHPAWKDAEISVFTLLAEEHMAEFEEKILASIKDGRLPISPRNIELITKKEDISSKDIINQKSKDADLTILGFRTEALKQVGAELFEGYEDIGDILFVNTTVVKKIE